MSSDPEKPTEEHDSNRDMLIAELLEQLIERRARGERVNIEQTASANPDLANELRQLWSAVLVADVIAAGSSEGPSDIIWDLGSVDIEKEENIGSETPTALSTIDDYELLEEIGRGGMGIVYRAQQKSLQRQVALKMMVRAGGPSETDLVRFRGEAEAIARLDHPNIVPIYDVGEHQGQPYFCMKLIEGETLAQRVARGPLPSREAATLLATIAKAIDYAHQRGILHRDLKPSNILIDPKGAPHITDFGLAKRITDAKSLTRSGAALGTPGYMAPEQAAGTRGQIGPATDVYGLGAVLYQMLTGRPPFQAASPLDTLLLVLEQDPTPPTMLGVKLDRDLNMILTKCLQKPPELRYDSAKSLANDVDAYLADEPISARSGRFSDVMARMFRSSHHAVVLENWGLLWIWHSVALLILCVTTNWFQLKQDDWPAMQSPLPYLILWGGGLAIWTPIFWTLRRRAGPVTFVERQIAHVWGGSIISSIMLYGVEVLMDLPVLTLSPVLGLINGMVFIVKAGILSGEFYVHAGVMFVTALLMALFAANDIPYGLTLFGVAAAGTFLIPGLKYHRRRKENLG